MDINAIYAFIGQFHLILLHFPIVFLTVVFALDILQVFFKKNFDQLANVTLWIGIFCLIPVILTGLMQSVQFGEGNHIMRIHRALALITFAFSLVHGLIRNYALKKKKANLIRFFLLFSLINFLLISVTAEEGALLSFGKTPFQTAN